MSSLRGPRGPKVRFGIKPGRGMGGGGNPYSSSIVRGLQGTSTRFDPVIVRLPWRSGGYLTSEKDPLGGDRPIRSKARARKRDQRRTILCIGCDRPMRAMTVEEVELPVCKKCLGKGDDYLLTLAKRVMVIEVEAKKLRKAGLEMDEVLESDDSA